MNAKALSLIFQETQRFVPPSVIGANRNEWVVDNLKLLGTQIRRSRYGLDNKHLKAAERAIRDVNRDAKNGFSVLQPVAKSFLPPL